MKINELTQDEIEIIQSRREKLAQYDAAKAFQSKAIAIAHAFSKWSTKTGDELTFSTFVNSFGYQGKDSNLMYETVKRIIEAAWNDLRRF
ncbi:hypothetical protein [Fastidiosibacter lacustris]|uniref:hypothetical protein n=1 Tax=Fastidiosibacter lacustris TaxID=2056695 RepID=UPI000E34E7B2|nr:hypothetical protein [Fastidiosibacter lacustris]